MALKDFFKKLSHFFGKIFKKIFDFFKRIVTSRLLKRVGSFFKGIPSKTVVFSDFFKTVSNYPPVSWFKKFTSPAMKIGSKYLNIALNISIQLLGKLRLGKVKDAVESLQIFFQPDYITGLTYNGNTISAVRVSSSLKGTMVDHTAIMPVKDPDNMTWELIEFARREEIDDDTLITCLSSSEATIRHIPIPIENVRKLSKIIKYQMEPYVPFPIDDMIIDFLPATSGNKVLTVGVERSVLSEHIELLAQAGLDPQTISLDDVALINLFHHTQSDQSAEASAIVHFCDDKTTVMVVKEKQLLFIRVLAPNKANPDAIKETLNIYALEYPDDIIDNIFIIGYPDVHEQLAKKMMAELGLSVSVWRPFDTINHQQGEMDADTQAKLSVPFGLALNGSNNRGKRFDLRKELFAIKNLITLKRFFLYAAYASLVLLILFTISSYIKLSALKHRSVQLQEDMKRIYVQAFPGAKPVKGTELKQMEQKINQEAKYKVLDSLGNGNTILRSITLLTQTFSKFQDIIIYQLSIEGYEIKLYGSAQSFETVDRLKKSLESDTSFQTIKLLDAKKNKRDKTIQFNFLLEKNQ